MNFLPLILIFVVFYFMLIRPQQKKLAEHQKVLSGLKRGDKVLTSGGIIATVSKIVSDDEISVEIAEGVKVRLRRSAIDSVLSPSDTPANQNITD